MVGNTKEQIRNLRTDPLPRACYNRCDDVGYCKGFEKWLLNPNTHPVIPHRKLAPMNCCGWSVSQRASVCTPWLAHLCRRRHGLGPGAWYESDDQALRRRFPGIRRRSAPEPFGWKPLRLSPARRGTSAGYRMMDDRLRGGGCHQVQTRLCFGVRPWAQRRADDAGNAPNALGWRARSAINRVRIVSG